MLTSISIFLSVICNTPGQRQLFDLQLQGYICGDEHMIMEESNKLKLAAAGAKKLDRSSHMSTISLETNSKTANIARNLTLNVDLRVAKTDKNMFFFLK
jgi:hypothetical protein